MTNDKDEAARRQAPAAVPQFGESDDILDICCDNVFKAVFTRNTRASQSALSKLVSALIGREVSITAVTVSARNYSDLKYAYQITILAKGRFFPDRQTLHTFQYYDIERRMPLDGKTRIITLELSKLSRVVKKPVEKMSAPEHWGVFFKYLTKKGKRETINKVIASEEGIAMASKVLMTITKDDIERARQLSQLRYELDTQSRLVYAERRGEKKGKKMGRLEGEKKGEMKIIELLKSGKPAEEIIREYGGR